MTVNVVGTGSVPTYVSDMSLQLWPDKPTSVSWSTALKLTDRRLARVATFETVDEHRPLPYLYWLSPFSQGDGYATAAESMAYWLLKSGIELSVHYSWFLVKDGLRPEILSQLEDPLDVPCLAGVCMATPGEFEKLPTPVRIGFTMYEASDPLRVYPEWKHQCNNVDFLFVPSKYCKEIFGRFVNVPIKVVPLAINEAYCYPVLRKPRGKFRVVTFATLTGRKAPLEMIEVFKRAFPTEDDVEFVLKTRLDLLGSQTPSMPEFDDERIRVVSGTWPLEKIRELLLASDCMMFLSKGEGFGMTPREAMATGLPTMLADNSGMSDVCNSRYNWPVPTRKFENSPLGGEWAVPDWDVAVEMLRDIYENREDAYGKAYRGAQWFIENHGPQVAADGCIQALNGIGDFKRAFIKRRRAQSKLPSFAPVPDAVQAEINKIAGRQVIFIEGYADLNCYAKNGCVVLGQRLLAMRDVQVRYAIDFLLTSAVATIIIAVPSVFVEPGQWSCTVPWRLEHLQHTLKGLTVPVLKFVADHTWLFAVVTRPAPGKALGGYGSVIDGRWKPT